MSQLVPSDLDADGLADVVVALPDGVAVALARADLDFTEPEALALPTDPEAAVVGDVDEDGLVDVLALRSAEGEAVVTVLPGMGDGNLGIGADIVLEEWAQGSPADLLLHDLDGDGHLDLVVTSIANDRLAILLGHGDGTFGRQQYAVPWVHPCRVEVGDLDHDAVPDLVVAHCGNEVLAVLLGVGDGSFAPAVTFPAAVAEVQDIALGDVDGDGHLDIVAAQSALDVVSLLRGVGDGTFGPTTSIPVGGGPTGVALADFDRDGSLDLAVLDAGDEAVRILPGNGDGTFGIGQDHPTGTDPLWLRAADMDGDGRLDLVSSSSQHISVHMGVAGGGFEPVRFFTTHWGEHADIADLTGDVAPDVVLVDALDEVRVVVNRSAEGGAFDELGQALAGVHGPPRLVGCGPLQADTTVSVTLTKAREDSFAWLVIGLDVLGAPFMGGTLVPDPATGSAVPLATGAFGTIALQGTWPSGVPSGFETWFQYWVVDSAGPLGFAASNALESRTP